MPIIAVAWPAGDQLSCLSCLHYLTELNMKGCYRVGDQGLSQLAALSHLHRLSLQGCWQISAPGLAHLTGDFFNFPYTSYTMLQVCSISKNILDTRMYISDVSCLLHSDPCIPNWCAVAVTALCRINFLRSMDIPPPLQPLLHD